MAAASEKEQTSDIYKHFTTKREVRYQSMAKGQLGANVTNTIEILKTYQGQSVRQLIDKRNWSMRRIKNPIKVYTRRVMKNI